MRWILLVALLTSCSSSSKPVVKPSGGELTKEDPDDPDDPDDPGEDPDDPEDTPDGPETVGPLGEDLWMDTFAVYPGATMLCGGGSSDGEEWVAYGSEDDSAEVTKFYGQPEITFDDVDRDTVVMLEIFTGAKLLVSELCGEDTTMTTVIVIRSGPTWLYQEAP